MAPERASTLNELAENGRSRRIHFGPLSQVREVNRNELVGVEGGANPIAACLATPAMMAVCGLGGVGLATWLLLKAYGWKLKKMGNQSSTSRKPTAKYGRITWADGSTFRYRLG